MGTRSNVLSEVLFSKVQQRVLALLYGQPDRSFYANEVVRLAASGTGAVHRELVRMVESGLLTEIWQGNRRHFQANRESPIFDELHAITVKTFGACAFLGDALAPLANRIQAAFARGLIPQRDESAESDVELFIVSDELSYDDIFPLLIEAEMRLGRTINPSLYKTEVLTQEHAARALLIKPGFEHPKSTLNGAELMQIL